ncbi:hypothetical protein DRO25_02420 [Candidatus Bathyarchaeota archaeon]|nr:MAG: hypothetical protein DRO25_02420 [Candidatus Bathyarchaeota archaeon]
MAMQRVPVGVVFTIAVAGIIASVLAAGLLMAYQRVPNSGNVKTVGVGVYWDNACTNNVTSIDWGFLEPGATVNKTVYIKNEGNTPMVLNITTDNWNPASASENITLSWNREGYVLNTTAPVVQAILTLSVSPNISGVTSFSFDIIITGTEQT